VQINVGKSLQQSVIPKQSNKSEQLTPTVVIKLKLIGDLMEEKWANHLN